jgi:hypothetical protein
MRAVPVDGGVFTALAALGKELTVLWTLLILAEAERKRMPQVIQAEMVGAACVGSVQERAMCALMHGANPSAADALNIGSAINRA